MILGVSFLHQFTKSKRGDLEESLETFFCATQKLHLPDVSKRIFNFFCPRVVPSLREGGFKREIVREICKHTGLHVSILRKKRVQFCKMLQYTKKRGAFAFCAEDISCLLIQLRLRLSSCFMRLKCNSVQ